ncbi:MAG: 4-(cytidine 5'-diphospho)-2-C-methyl-D-erythritol kinase [Clostridia bacterium]|nr:4-(cytidine 5'-diphospho)-2-C-methyl-D-erythritol kinase [Clostridia bacterium]
MAADENNLVLRAARCLKAFAGVQQGAAMTLVKRIPAGAGMGGGSADAAAALKMLNQLWQLHLPLETLQELALPLGADIPFCLQGGLCRVQGIGEKLTPIGGRRTYPLVLLQPREELSTAAVFRESDAMPSVHGDTFGVLKAIDTGDMQLLEKSSVNSLQGAAMRLVPAIAAAQKELLAQGALFARMTGSGSVTYGVFESAAAADRAAEALKGKWPVVLRTETCYE